MPHVCRENGGRSPVLSICRVLCIWATWVRVAASLPQGATDSNAPTDSLTSTILGLVPSPRPTGLIPSAPRPPGLIPSQSRPSGLIPSQSQLSSLPPQTAASTSLPFIESSAQPPSNLPSSVALIPSKTFPIPSNPTTLPSVIDTLSPTAEPTPPKVPNVSSSTSMPKASTDEGLRPIPGPTTAPGNPDGHHEIPEPGFHSTNSCRGCSPAIEIPATGWESSATAIFQETTERPPQAIITAGPSNILITPEPSGGGFVVGGSTTVYPGQTVTFDNTPIVIQTPNGRTEVVVGGTQTVPFKPPGAGSPPSQITNPPALPIIIGSQTLIPVVNTDSNNPNSQPQYIISGQTLIPGGPALTISSSTYSLDSSGTAIVINGQTSTIRPSYGIIYTTTALPPLTLWGSIYTANRAGYYIISPGTTLIPGGLPVTVSGSVISLEPKGTAAIIGGSTSYMQPSSTVVTLTKSGIGGADGGYSAEGDPAALPYPTGNPQSGASRLDMGGLSEDLWLHGVFMLGAVIVGWLGIWL